MRLIYWFIRRIKSRWGGMIAEVRVTADVKPGDVFVPMHWNDQFAGNGAVNELLGGSPGERPERYAGASPIEMLPLGVRQLIVHGVQDEALPIDMSRDYAAAARAAGDAVELVELPAAGHMDSVDPASAAHHALRDWLSSRVPALRG